MNRVYLDIEVYSNYFLALFMNEAGKAKRFEIFNDDDSTFDVDAIDDLITNKDLEFITFNGNSYDIPLLTLAMDCKDTEEVKHQSNRIIEDNLRPWHFYKQMKLREPNVNHIDLMEVAPGMVGLKLYGGRMGTKLLQELPIPHDSVITDHQLPELQTYCKNDTVLTRELYHTLEAQIDLRRAMSEEYGVDLRSKSDAQIAEAVLKAEYATRTGKFPEKVNAPRKRFFYEPPAYIKFSTPVLQEAFETVCAAEMVLKNTGHVEMPKAISNLKIEIASTTYKVGIGGLHSQESGVAHIADADTILLDRDVESYYPVMMLNMNMAPGGFGKHFNPVYRRILDTRLAAKHAKDMVTSNSLKIVLNGTFGKTSSKYSTLYSPEFMIRTTLSGQLTLLMLIEALERCGIPVVSANTDGIVIKCDVSRKDDLDKIVAAWQKHTGLKTEETLYKALYSRDVNNYIAVKPDGSAKAKGVYGKVSLSKNPQNPICAEAVIAFLTQGVPVSDTVRGCDDIRKFLTLRTVTGGAVKDEEPLGKAIRWYYAAGEKGTIHYLTNNNTVPRSRGAKVLMDLPDDFPADVDYSWYEKECNEMLMAVGAIERPFVEKIPRKNSNAWKELRDTGKIVENDEGKWEWNDE